MVYSMKEWLERMKDVPVRYLVYKRFLPDGAHITEDEFTSTTYECAFINAAIDTGHGWILALEGIDDDGRTGIVSYYNLNEIRIEVFACDKEAVHDDECEQ